MRASSAKLKVLRGGKIAKLHVQRTMRPMFPANSEPPNEFASTSSPRTTGTSPSRDGSQLSDAAGRPATSEVKWGAHEPIARGGASVAGRKRALPSAKENPFFNFVDLFLMMSKRKRENDLMMMLPSSSWLPFTLGVYLTMRKSPNGCDHPAYGIQLSDILSKAKREDEIVREMIDTGVRSLNDAAQKPATTMIGSVVQEIHRRRLRQLQGTRLLCSRDFPVTLLDLQALAVQHQFSIVVLETARRAMGSFEPRSIRIIYPDDRLVSDPIPPGQLAEQLDQRVDDALWLVLTRDGSSPATFRAHPAFRYPTSAWLDLQGPPLFAKTLDPFEEDALRTLKRSCAKQTGISLADSTDLQRSILFYLSLSKQAKQFRGKSQAKRGPATDEDRKVKQEEKEEKEKKEATTTKKTKSTRRTQETKWLTEVFKVEKRLHDIFKSYIKDKCLDVWRPQLEQAEYAAQMVSREFAAPVDRQLLEHPPAFSASALASASASHQDHEADDKNPFFEQLNVAHDVYDSKLRSSSGTAVETTKHDRSVSAQHGYPLLEILEVVNGVPLFGEEGQSFSELVEELARSTSPGSSAMDAGGAAPSPADDELIMAEELAKLKETYNLEDAAAPVENDPFQIRSVGDYHEMLLADTLLGAEAELPQISGWDMGTGEVYLPRVPLDGNRAGHIGQARPGGTKRKQEAMEDSRAAKHGRKDGWIWER